MEDISTVTKQLEGEVQMYDALTREFCNGNREAVDLDEVREWAMRNLEVINKALFGLSKRGRVEDCPDKKTRDETISALFYLKERITTIEQKAMTANPFRSLSPKSRDQASRFNQQSIGTTSAASVSRHDGRDNPFNQVQNVASSRVSRRPSDCDSDARRTIDPYFNSVKEDLEE